MRIQVVLADEQAQEIFEYDVSSSSKIKNLMGLQEVVDFVKRTEANYSISISGQKVSQQHYLQPFDRVEFLRPLKLTPKEWRRKRARKA
ncbi:MAG: RnfH family protein [Pseudomonadota bacterium]|nr:RnfH family protein [Pseudomonadota bacterium]